MLTTKLAATLVALAAFTIAPSVASAAPEKRSHPAVVESVNVKYTLFDANKNEVAIETLEFATGYWLPEVNDEVL